MSETEKIILRDRHAAIARTACLRDVSAAIGGGLFKARIAGATMLVTIALALSALASAHGSFASFPSGVAAAFVLAPLFGIVDQNLCAAALAPSRREIDGLRRSAPGSFARRAPPSTVAVPASVEDAAHPRDDTGRPCFPRLARSNPWPPPRVSEPAPGREPSPLSGRRLDQ